MLPLVWIVVFAFTSKDGAVTASNFGEIFLDPTFQEPLLTTLIIAVSVGVICSLIAAPMGWLVARSDMPGRKLVRAPGHRIVRDTAVSRRYRLGTAGRAQ